MYLRHIASTATLLIPNCTKVLAEASPSSIGDIDMLQWDNIDDSAEVLRDGDKNIRWTSHERLTDER